MDSWCLQSSLLTFLLIPCFVCPGTLSSDVLVSVLPTADSHTVFLDCLFYTRLSLDLCLSYSSYCYDRTA